MTEPERDEDLVGRFLAGDQQAFAALVERHQTRVFNVALRVLGDAEDARDATQDAFVSMLRKLSQFRGESAFTTWLHRVTVNSCYDILRKRRRQPMLRLVSDEDDPMPETGPPVADHADATVDSIDVSRALQQIPEEYRMTLVLADIQDLPYEEIARVLDVPDRHREVPRPPRPHRSGSGDGPGWPLPGTDLLPAAVGGRVMTHPEELLAGYVDGTLSAKDRAAVEAHLAACSRCSREVELARGARTALRSLTEVPAPQGVATKALEEATGARPAVGGTPRWYRFGGVAAAVAAGLLVFTLVLPHIGNGAGARVRSLARQGPGGGRGRSRGSSAGGGERDRDPTRELRRRLVDRLDLVVSEPEPGRSGAGAAAAPVAPAFGTQAQTGKALACLVKSAPDQGGRAPNAHPGAVQGHARLPRGVPRRPGRGSAGRHRDRVGLRHEGLQDPSFSSGQL